MSVPQDPPSFNPPPPDRKAAQAAAKGAKAHAKALRPWYRKKRFWLLALIALVVIVAIASSGSKKPKSKAASSPTTTFPIGSVQTLPPVATTTTVPPPTTTTTAFVDPGVVMTITGTGTALVTILDGGGESQHQGAPLPYSVALHDSPSIYGISAQTNDGSSSAVISCSLGGDASTVTNSSSGAYAVVDCSGSSF